MAVIDGFDGDIFRQQRFTDPIGAEQDRIGGVTEKGEGHEVGNRVLINLLRPIPVEVSQGFQTPQSGVA